jgi:hypothetical protein
VAAYSPVGRAILTEMPWLRELVGNAAGITLLADDGTILLTR